MRIARAFIVAAMAISLGSCDTVQSVVDSTIEAAQATPALELIGLGPELPCDVDRYDARRLSGTYYRVADGSVGGEVLFVTGRLDLFTRSSPRSIILDDSSVWPISEGADGALSTFWGSTASPIRSLKDGTDLPLAYTLSYRANAVDYTGPMVVGIPPRQEEIPKTGTSIMSGLVELSQTTFSETGAPSISKATGRFELRIGYRSGRATFTLENIASTQGAPLSFAKLTWNRLALCGARLVSSGQGLVRKTDRDGKLLPLFGPDADPAAGALQFQSSMFAGDTRPGPPGGVGGIFTLESDASALTGVFLSQNVINPGGAS
ncbi:hypothetical protein [Yoonia sediminilitoris]|uniref:Transferrin-binding protein B C-lobe/N-lobe beta barrel domain-containing protein n=1 Tax=Yoonia sediminilitoris TaxID=1286148 RepID=A0A2T6KME0_9RHOB|nr:hypothetical protein [Yoonia sediminilitoris]PUB17385.1 hypothetical protein C8N45_102397 [Yoonia sediminilitoris]RCW97680.1 hypothetical protein DFP92_102397 [Yoonia sediminilitoris]